ncbi:hypothetical protein L7F22_038320 [Adiantum nelumboides]|nr:hypothetical protein [Adiantum nelumboides]
MHGNGLTFEQCKWFCCKGFKIEPTLYGEQQSLPKFKGSFVDDLAPIAMHELTASVSRVLDNNQGLVSSVVGALLCSNELPYIMLKWLVRSDSLVDIAACSNLYLALLAFMRTVSGSYDFLPLLCSHEAKHETIETQSCWETPSYVLEKFSKPFKQVQFMLCWVEQLNNGQKNVEEGNNLNLIAELSLGDVKKTKGESVSSVPSPALVEAYKEALWPLQFDKDCLFPTHYFWLLARKSESLMLDKRRACTISEEMTLFNTRLPLEWDSSIFLCMDEQRMDVLWALIIGPKDTPYENGVFLFDILLEVTYLDKPPKVQFLTSGGGQVRFNPNLYECGKVYLSILGTWHQGPGWKAGQSSIMQVLVSIQGLVLVANLYYNEPGYARGMHQAAADEYILDQRLNTIEHSMLPALCCPDLLFLPVSHTHFRLKAAQILSQCTAWM